VWTIQDSGARHSGTLRRFGKNQIIIEVDSRATSSDCRGSSQKTLFTPLEPTRVECAIKRCRVLTDRAHVRPLVFNIIYVNNNKNTYY
jgi:hypothetical protein